MRKRELQRIIIAHVLHRETGLSELRDIYNFIDLSAPRYIEDSSEENTETARFGETGIRSAIHTAMKIPTILENLNYDNVKDEINNVKEISTLILSILNGPKGEPDSYGSFFLTFLVNTFGKLFDGMVEVYANPEQRQKVDFLIYLVKQEISNAIDKLKVIEPVKTRITYDPNIITFEKIYRDYYGNSTEIPILATKHEKEKIQHQINQRVYGYAAPRRNTDNKDFKSLLNQRT